MNDYNNLSKVSDFDSLMDQLYKSNYSTYDSRLMYSPTYHMYNMDESFSDGEELYLSDYNIDDDYE